MPLSSVAPDVQFQSPPPQNNPNPNQVSKLGGVNNMSN